MPRRGGSPGARLMVVDVEHVLLGQQLVEPGLVDPADQDGLCCRSRMTLARVKAEVTTYSRPMAAWPKKALVVRGRNGVLMRQSSPPGPACRRMSTVTHSPTPSTSFAPGRPMCVTLRRVQHAAAPKMPYEGGPPRRQS